MAQFESRRREIEAARAQLAFIAAEKRDGVWKPGRFLEKHPIASVFLLDEDRTVTRTYGLHHALATDAINIAHPATLLIDHGGLVRYIYCGDNQLDRAPLDEVLGALQGL
jgi:peroxiredoxin